LVTASAVTRIKGGHGLTRELHEGTWAGAWSGALNLVSALGLGTLLATGVVAWWRRRTQARARSGDTGADLLVAFASQTGTAARFAEATAAALRRAGERVACASLAALAPEELTRFKQVFLLVSTTGDGEVPDQGRAFLHQLGGADLAGAAFTMLALGDRRYRRFCAGGERVRAALLAAGARETARLARADDEPTPAWRAWLEAAHDAVPPDLTPPEPDRPVTLTLVERERLDDPADPDVLEAWSLALASPEPLAYRPGDLLLVAPAEGAPERCYSIGSTPLASPARLQLTIGLRRWRDERGHEHLGAASGLLCRRLAPGEPVRGRLRRHPAFNPPADPRRPILMVASGCGIAPFIGFLAERALQPAPGPAWLIFGNRKRAADFFYGAQLERWLADGVLSRLDLAFSRDPDDGSYVQHRLLASGGDVLRWLTVDDAVFYVCGRASTTGQGVQAALERICTAEAGGTADAATRRMAGWLASGTIRRDLFE
jgi:sulfite reductase (NADPH) flavoprotein alpha-component